MKIKVNDMTCAHCAATIQKSLLSKGVVGTVSHVDKVVSIQDKDYDKAISAIKDAGYTPEE
ncbi:heavy-metal-associated domain-containing protein [Acholeplasma equifetale]|jgi:copper chaperone|uniref:heavy-metal-associated domain-containing protein n=1 Tax=Acholeplasma equifetale TaxID=264634 RepID=UPI00054E4FE3|nr:heavy metal-associated domain-containing protein [Acholeplasma equifetale]HHY96856.1 heavy-metal-associated domain-containing protein [Acholeplasma sp.]